MGDQADLRRWLAVMEEHGEVQTVSGARPNLEIGAISEHNYRQSRHRALLFEDIPGYPDGARLLTGSISTAARLGSTFRLGEGLDDMALVEALRGKPGAWEAAAASFSPVWVTDGPVMENRQVKPDTDLTIFPAPFWHEHDGGRYLGTGGAVITQDPGTGRINAGCYRMMITDDGHLVIQIVPGKHGRQHYERWWKREGRAPVVVSLGHDPLLFALAGTEISDTVSELNYYGAVVGQPLEVIRGEVTGLPIPAASEIVVEGYIDPDHHAPEGPYGEWTGYYSGSRRESPVLQVERVYHRNDPIVLGAPPGLPPHDFSYFRTVFKSASIQDALIQAGVTGLRGVWCHEAGAGRMLVNVSLRQAYCGHARQVGHLAAQLPAAAYMNRYVIVVDDDIDPRNLQQVMWAVCTRCDPATDIDIIHKAWGSPADPMNDQSGPPYNSRGILDACIPYERRDSFPRVARMSEELERDIAQRWARLWEAEVPAAPVAG
jgi:UbiD family decarboxylase